MSASPVLAASARLLGVAAVICATMTAVLVAFEDSFIYFPERGGRVTARGRDVWLRASDGVRLHAFHVDALEGAPAARTLLYLHGNAGNLAGRSDVLEYYAAQGVNVLGLDYRGYGQSEGTPSESGLYADALAAYDWLVERVPARDVIVLGESLGGGPACELALRRAVGGLVLLSTFTSVPDMAARTFPFLPVRFVVRTRFDNRAKVARIAAPKLIVHSRKDEVIPFAMGEQLARAAKPPVQQLWLDRAGHNDTYYTEGARFGAALRAFTASRVPE